MFPRKTFRWPKANEKTLHITNPQGKANQSHSEISPHTYQSGCYQKGNKQQVPARARRRSPPALLAGMRTEAATTDNSADSLKI